MNIKNKDMILSVFILIFIIITSFFLGYSWNNFVVKKDKKDSNLKIENVEKNTKNSSDEKDIDTIDSEIKNTDIKNVVDEKVEELAPENKIDISSNIEENNAEQQSNDNIVVNKISEEKKINSEIVETAVKIPSNSEQPINNKEEEKKQNNNNCVCKCNVTCPSKDDKNSIANTNSAYNKNKQTAKSKKIINKSLKPNKKKEKKTNGQVKDNDITENKNDNTTNEQDLNYDNVIIENIIQFDDDKVDEISNT